MVRTALIGWTAVIVSTVISGLWAFWGAFESFHEGWYYESLRDNVSLTFRYNTLMLAFMLLSLVAVRWPRAGGALYELFGVGFCTWILMTRGVLTLAVVVGWLPVIVPPLFLGVLFWFGRPTPLPLAYSVLTLAPLAVWCAFAAEPVARIAGRVEDHDRGIRTVQGNGVTLVWAPEGPGWPRPDPKDKDWVAHWRGPTWEEARQACRRLTPDGTTVDSTVRDIWRLPTAEEVVRSMARHGSNSGGVWSQARGRASYAIRPDKEPPLWNPHCPIIYWWTSSEQGPTRASAIDFQGNVYSRLKTSTLGSQAFRAVKNFSTDNELPDQLRQAP